MNIDEKLELLRNVEASGFNITDSLRRLDIPRSTYYRWRSKFRKLGRKGLKDKQSKSVNPWNKILPRDEKLIYYLADKYPELSSREISVFMTDNYGISISETTVYRYLKAKGLIR